MTATEKLEMITGALAAGNTVLIGNPRRLTKITPKAAARWVEAGKPLVKVSGDGKSLKMIEGRGYVCADYCDIIVQ